MPIDETTAAQKAEVVDVDDKAVLAAFFEQHKPLHLYEIGDLDPFFWPSTRWFGWRENGNLKAIALLYTGTDVPTLLLLEHEHGPEALSLLGALQPQLPSRFYAHLSPGLESSLGSSSLAPHGRHLKMVLNAPGEVVRVATDGVELLGRAHADDLSRFYERSYPGHWFMPRMLETGQYFGLRSGGALVCVAGVHVYSPEYGVAALGNITTSPEHRNKGLGRLVTAHLCQSLLETVETIGLNVHAENEHAIRCYGRLGFEIVAEYDEYMVESASR